MPDLAALYRQRANEPMFQQRDEEYREMRDYYKGEKSGGAASWGRGSQGKPVLMRDTPFESSGRKINIVAQLVNHFTAMFARVPPVRALPVDADQSSLALAERETMLIRVAFNRSGMGMRQPQQSFRFSLYGDCVYAVEAEEDRRLPVFIRTYDPADCYPHFSENDLGAVDDMLIRFKVPREWAQEQYALRLPERPALVSVYHYWTRSERSVQVEEYPVNRMFWQHSLGFVPFRWAFSRPMGETGMSDVRDVPAAQDAYNEVFGLMMDTVRKHVVGSYWAKGVTGIITPIPGKAVGLSNPEASINQWPLSDPPSVAMEILGQIMGDAARMAGISPISLEGQASGSIVTGRAVRNQVEAIEARAETKKVVLEATFARLGEYLLQLLAKLYPERTINWMEGQQAGSFRGDESKGWYECEAIYGDLYGVNFQGRVQTALQGLGRLWDERQGIRLADPGWDESAMVQRIEDYQKRQAALMGGSQAIAQLAGQKEQEQNQPGQPQTPPGTMPPQMAQGPTPPGPGQFLTTLGQVEDSLLLVKARLEGAVWAVGELAIAGMSPTPTLMVEKRKDLPLVEPLAQSLHGVAVPGAPEKTTMARKLT